MTLRRLGLALFGITLAGLVALAIRLDRGPVSLTFLVDRIEAALDPEGPGRVEIADLRLAWEGWGEGGFEPIELHFSGLRAIGPDGAPWLEAPDATVALAPGSLLLGELAPRWAELRDPRLLLHRRAGGAIGSGPVASAGADAAPEGDAATPSAASLLRPSPDQPLASLRHLSVTGGEAVVEDRQIGRPWRVQDVFLALNRGMGDGLRGWGSAELAIGDAAVPLRLQAEPGTEAAQVVTVTLPQIRPAELAGAAPGLSPLGVLEAEVALHLRVVLAEDGSPVQATAEVRAGAGRIDIPGAGAIPFSGLRLDLAAGPRQLRVERLALDLAPARGSEGRTGPRLTAQGTARLADGAWRAEADLALDHASLPALETWWPTGLAPAARGWVTENLAAGLLRDGRWHVEATAPEDLARVELTGLDGRAELDGVAVRWHPALPPLEALSGRAEFRPDGITLLAEGGRQAGTELRLSGGRLRLTGLGAGPARAELRGHLTGPVSDLWDLLRRPELGLLAGQDLPIRDPTGRLEAQVAATVPLAGPSVATDPAFEVTARLAELRLPDLLLGGTLASDAVTVRVDRGGLRADGSARLAGIPVQADLAVDFPQRPRGGVAVRLTAEARPRAEQLAALGLDPGEAVTGPVGITARYASGGDAPARLALRAELEAARLSLPALGLAKPPGAPAHAEAVLRIADGGLRGIERLEAEGPGLLIRARGAAGTGRVEIEAARIGETRFTGTLRPPAETGGTWSASLHGPVIDLRPILEGLGGDEAGGPDKEGAGGMPPLVLEARFDRALTPAEGRALHDLSGRATLGGEVAVAEAQLAGRTGQDGASFSATLSRRPEGGRAIRIEAADTGALLSALGYDLPLRGGRLELDATQAAPVVTSPITGRAEMHDFAVLDAPAFARLLQALTGYGLVNALSGPGLGFSNMIVPFRLEEEALLIGEARAFSASLGVTAQGRIDRQQRTLDIEGTVVPAYAFNSLLGHLPLVGRIFSPEEGGGLFSANFDVNGPISDPRVSVNPLSALTPGFLRGLFRLGEEEAPPAEARPAAP